MQHVVLSPGSRCAPLVIAFNRLKELECLSVVDERSAAFFALGIAQQTGKPVGLICTSGSAILNYAPALAEAYYQKIPLVVMTADRPNEWIDQGENQSIQQYEVFKNFIKKSFQLPVQINEDKDLWFSDRLVSEAINTSLYPDFGPVHINVPLREPLYELEEDTDSTPKIIHFPSPSFSLAPEEWAALSKSWNAAEKKLIVVGSQKHPSKEVEKLLNALAKNESVVILKEAISNINGTDFIEQIDPNIELITSNNLNQFTPDIVLTFGGSVVSKKLKFWLRKKAPKSHWHVTKNFEHWDNFQSLSKVLQSDVLPILENLVNNQTASTSTYKKEWITLNSSVQQFTEKYIQELPFSDFKVFDFILKSLPETCNVHLGNSTPVRYANLLQLDPSKNLIINSNRGVSGIDGVSSTAAGSAYVNGNKLTFVITGDIAFMYDSNAFWNKHLKWNFKVILINNGGGNIFKIIPGPDKLEELDTYFETSQHLDARQLCKAYNLAYFEGNDLEQLEVNWKDFIAEKEKAAVLEIRTSNELSASSLKTYFTELIKDINL